MYSSGSSESGPASNIDAYALFEALTGKKIDKDTMSTTSSKTMADDFEDLGDYKTECTIGKEPQPDSPPKHQEIRVGCINPYALVEAMLGHKLDKTSFSVARIISDVLQTDYDELFDMKHESVLYAGLKLNQKERCAEELRESDIKILEERDLVTPDLSAVQRLNDLERIGLKNLGETKVKMARMQNGKLRVVLDAETVARTVSNRDVTMSLNELAVRFRRDRENRQKGKWTPPNSSWRNMNEVIFQHLPQRLVTDMTRMRIHNYCETNQMYFNNINMNSCNYTMNNNCRTLMNKFDDPVQGATGNSWLIAAIFSVFWANPACIKRVSRSTECGRDFDDDNEGHRHRSKSPERRHRSKSPEHSPERRHRSKSPEHRHRSKSPERRHRSKSPERRHRGGCGDDRRDMMTEEYMKHHHGGEYYGGHHHRGRRLAIKFHDKGGRNNAETRTVEVDCEVPINNSSNEPVYCRASGETDIWPALYEKAFAKWMTRTHSDRPDITQTAHGDPIKAMAQINGREPRYYFTEKHEATDLVGVVRHSCVNFKTISPMCAFTHASGRMYRGANLVANHAYSVLGWTTHGDRQYIIVRNPWGVTEPMGLTSYPGLLDRVEPEFWRPACMLDCQGVLAIEAHAFREYFACLGVAK